MLYIYSNVWKDIDNIKPSTHTSIRSIFALLCFAFCFSFSLLCIAFFAGLLRIDTTYTHHVRCIVRILIQIHSTHTVAQHWHWSVREADSSTGEWDEYMWSRENCQLSKYPTKQHATWYQHNAFHHFVRKIKIIETFEQSSWRIAGNYRRKHWKSRGILGIRRIQWLVR